MNPEIKVRWVAALRSGEYAQGHGALSRDYPWGRGHCCLGVLCELAVKDGVIPASGHEGTYSYDGHHSYLPRRVRDWADLSIDSPIVSSPFTQGEDGPLQSLASLNDQGHSFAEIADLIEEQL